VRFRGGERRPKIAKKRRGRKSHIACLHHEKRERKKKGILPLLVLGTDEFLRKEREGGLSLTSLCKERKRTRSRSAGERERVQGRPCHEKGEGKKVLSLSDMGGGKKKETPYVI